MQLVDGMPLRKLNTQVAEQCNSILDRVRTQVLSDTVHRFTCMHIYFTQVSNPHPVNIVATMIIQVPNKFKGAKKWSGDFKLFSDRRLVWHAGGLYASRQWDGLFEVLPCLQ